MRIVLDSSVAIKWEVAEADSPNAQRIRDDFRTGIHQLLSVDIFKIEAAHALTRAERQRRIQPGDAKKILAAILLTSPQLFPFEPFMDRALDISSSMRVGVYDCLYVALAEQEKCELVTADTTMLRALQATFPFIKPLSSMP